MSLFTDSISIIQQEYQAKEQLVTTLQNSIIEKDAEIARLNTLLPKFRLFDSTGAKTLGAGFEPVILLTESNFYPTDARGAPDLTWFKTVSLPKIKARYPDSKRFVIDIEWFFSSGATAQEVLWYVDIVKTMKDFAPDWEIGAYSCPLRSQNHLTGTTAEIQTRTQAWLDAQVVFKPLLSYVDFGAISIYVLTSNEDLFERYVRSNIDMWKYFSNKPVYPYFWPEYHRNAKRPDGTSLEGVAVPASLMRKALDICYEKANGISIWHFAAYRLDTSAAWWIELNSWRNEKGL
jgi:hypothetical protein